MGKKTKVKAMENNIPNPSLPQPSVNSEFQLPGIRYQFSNEPHWIRMVFFLVSLGVLVLFVCLIKEWILPLLAKDAVVSNVAKVIKSIRGKDP